VPASFVERYEGTFDEVFATASDGGVTGFIQPLGKGQVMVFGAALAANTLEDLDILHQMANRMGLPPLFEMSDWADVRLSEGENGSFLFLNNYQDDPIETTVTMAGKPLFGGAPIALPARSGLILPLEWKHPSGSVVHFLTAELRERQQQDGREIWKVEPAGCLAEISVRGEKNAPRPPARIRGREGILALE
jgi:beta-galactosidase